MTWHRLLGPSADAADLQQPLPLDPVAADPPDHSLAPEMKVVVISLVAALVEVLAGRRPPHQLHEWTSTAVSDRVESLCTVQQQRDWRLRSLRAQQPGHLRVEATVHLIQAGRSRAAALCITRQQQRWMITEFCITPTRQP